MKGYTVRYLYKSGNAGDGVYLAKEVDARIAELEKALRELTYRSTITNQIMTVKCDATKIMRALGLAD